MRFQTFDTRLQVSLASGEEVVASLIALLRTQDIGYAAITGLGALSRVRLAYWDSASQEYEEHVLEEQVELVSLVGNAARRDGEPALHLHASIGRRDLSLIGGHLMEAIAHPNLELWLHAEEGSVVRQVDPACGLPLMQLPQEVDGG